VERGDEVFVPTFTFIASANAVVYQGGQPTLVDSESETWNLDPAIVGEEIERRRRNGTPLPKAIEIVHILGHPANIEQLVQLCEANEIALLEDAAEALGARYRGGPFDSRHVGTIGNIGCFSFNGNKVITTGGGGMLVTDDPNLASHAKHLTRQARLPGLAYRHDEVGYNYRLSNVSAAIGVAQLEQLDRFLEAKRRIAGAYDDALRRSADVVLAPSAAWADRSAWLYTIRLRNAETANRVLGKLLDAEIGARPVWPPLHKIAPFLGASLLGDGSVAEQIGETAISLPSSVQLSEGDQHRVIDTVVEALDG
jgi:dTDP-4-amino-4,6-dideoxygalactose transaminase